MLTIEKRLMGASLLVFANKTDIDDCMTNSEIQQVRDQGYCGPSKDTVSSSLQGLRLDAIKTHRRTIIRCSARTRREELREGVEWVVQDAKDRLFLF